MSDAFRAHQVIARFVVQDRWQGRLMSQVLAPGSLPCQRSPTHRTMASISSKTFAVAEHIPEDDEHRATRRFLVNPECLRPFKLTAGEVVAIVSSENPDSAVGVSRSICFYHYSDVSLTRRIFLQSFSAGLLWPDSELEKDGHFPRQTI